MIVWYGCDVCGTVKETFDQDESYSVQEVSQFLTPEECIVISELSTPRLSNSNVYLSSGDILSTSVRKSEQCWLKDSDHPFISLKQYQKKLHVLLIQILQTKKNCKLSNTNHLDFIYRILMHAIKALMTVVYLTRIVENGICQLLCI